MGILQIYQDYIPINYFKNYLKEHYPSLPEIKETSIYAIKSPIVALFNPSYSMENVNEIYDFLRLIDDKHYREDLVYYINIYQINISTNPISEVFIDFIEHFNFTNKEYYYCIIDNINYTLSVHYLNPVKYNDLTIIKKYIEEKLKLIK